MAAAEAGVDALGMVFYSDSPRCVDTDYASTIVTALPPFIKVIGVFVNPQVRDLQGVCAQVPLDLVQLHGDETPADCARYGQPYIKGLRMRDGIDVDALSRTFAGCRALLLDSYVPGQAGGTGATFEWHRIPAVLDKPIILAGGLNPENVDNAVHAVRPYAVDVSSGVERSPGRKDADRIRHFVAAVRRADQGLTMNDPEN